MIHEYNLKMLKIQVKSKSFIQKVMKKLCFLLEKSQMMSNLHEHYRLLASHYLVPLHELHKLQVEPRRLHELNSKMVSMYYQVQACIMVL
ncbi:TPA: hypothetical protein DEP21_05585 [Patescibacteria group bacterium]|nr:hypothetical protein [Candidatus Gracilibacteria bacterium]